MKKLLAGLVAMAGLAWAGAATQQAAANTCVAQCRAAHNQCRIAARAVAAPQCDAQLQACMERCSRAR